MTKFYLLLLIISNFAGLSFSAELSTGSSTNLAREENRFLFVVETSLPMGRMSKAAAETVRELIGSGMQGQMQPGDTFGIWTFNEQLSAEFPMQQWTPAGSEKFAQDAFDYLKKKRFEKKAVLLTVIKPLSPVIKSSRAITVILISGGKEPMSGTPFDQEINSVYPVYASELREAKLPFVTILVGRNGKWVAHSVNSSLGPIQIPNPPIVPVPVVLRPATNVATLLPSAATNPIAKPKPIVPNIIMAKPTVPNTIVEVIPANTNLAEKVEVPVAVVKTNVTTFTADSAKEIGTAHSVSNATAPSIAIKSETTFVAPTNSQTASVAGAPVEKALAPLDSPTAKNPSSNAVNRQNAASVAESLAASSEIKTNQTSAPVVAATIVAKPKSLLLSAAAILMVVVVVVFMLVRRSHNKPQSSLISRSMEQRK